MIAQPANLPIPSPTASPVTVPPTQENTIDRILTLLQQLAPEQQQYVLDFVEFLVQKHNSKTPKSDLWDILDRAAANIPQEERALMPTDGSYQHDHYLYGTPKREL